MVPIHQGSMLFEVNLNHTNMTIFSTLSMKALGDMLQCELGLYGIDVHTYFPPTLLTPGLDEENKTKPNLLKEIEEGDAPVAAVDAASSLFRGEGQFTCTCLILTCNGYKRRSKRKNTHCRRLHP
jgi:hypothetical protein